MRRTKDALINNSFSSRSDFSIYSQNNILTQLQSLTAAQQ